MPQKTIPLQSKLSKPDLDELQQLKYNYNKGDKTNLIKSVVHKQVEQSTNTVVQPCRRQDTTGPIGEMKERSERLPVAAKRPQTPKERLGDFLAERTALTELQRSKTALSSQESSISNCPNPVTRPGLRDKQLTPKQLSTNGK